MSGSYGTGLLIISIVPKTTEDSRVGAPLKPKPALRVSGIALPEPDDNRPDDDQMEQSNRR
jgi:hypothetical protein